MPSSWKKIVGLTSMGARCRKCGERIHPQSTDCPFCLQPNPLKRTGLLTGLLRRSASLKHSPAQEGGTLQKPSWPKISSPNFLVPVLLGGGVLSALLYLFIISLPRDRIEGEAMVREHAYEGSQFIELISTARKCSKESLATRLNYPAHSLVIYTWIRREDADLGREGLQLGDPGEYRLGEAFCHS